MGLVSYSLDPEARASSELHNRFHYDEADDRVVMERFQDVEPILKANRERRNHESGFDGERDFKHVARIPLIVIEKIIAEQGWNPMLDENKPRLMKLLDDPEYAYLRTSTGRLSGPMRTYSRASTASIKVVGS